MVRLTAPPPQAADWDCGRAAAGAIYNHYGVPAPAGPWPGGPHSGTHPASLAEQFHRAGLRVQSGPMTVADLRHHTEAADRPVVALVRAGGGTVGHYVVVVGARRRRVYFWEPAAGKVESQFDTAFAARWWDSDSFGFRYDRFALAVSHPERP